MVKVPKGLAAKFDPKLLEALEKAASKDKPLSVAYKKIQLTMDDGNLDPVYKIVKDDVAAVTSFSTGNFVAVKAPETAEGFLELAKLGNIRKIALDNRKKKERPEIE